MNSWKDIPARQNAVREFVKHLRDEPDERAKCIADGDYAKGLFAKLGDFEIQKESYPDDETRIPKKMEFRVYEENNTTQRDQELGVMVLPNKPDDPVDVSKVWRCTWQDWTAFQ